MIRPRGPCKKVLLKGGLMKALCKGSQIAFTLDEPAQGGLAAAITVGDLRACAAFGGSAVEADVPTSGSTGTGMFKAKSAARPEVCPVP